TGLERRRQKAVARLDAARQRLAQLGVLLTQFGALLAQFARLAQLAGDAVEHARHALRPFWRRHAEIPVPRDQPTRRSAHACTLPRLAGRKENPRAVVAKVAR